MAMLNNQRVVHHIIYPTAGWPPPSPETVHSEPHGLPMPPSEGLRDPIGMGLEKGQFHTFLWGFSHQQYGFNGI